MWPLLQFPCQELALNPLSIIFGPAIHRQLGGMEPVFRLIVRGQGDRWFWALEIVRLLLGECYFFHVELRLSGQAVGLGLVGVFIGCLHLQEEQGVYTRQKGGWTASSAHRSSPWSLRWLPLCLNGSPPPCSKSRCQLE